MTESSPLQTSGEIVATQAVERFVAAGLLPKHYATALQIKLVEGNLRADDWRLWVEKAIEWEQRGATDEQ